jgi:23S rRNA pseudouridine955/2504/2580 synthase
MAHAGWPLLGDGKYGRERFNREFGEKGQALYSYRLEFAFPTDAGILNYLRGKTFAVNEIDFVEKYFPGVTLPAK